MSAFWPGPGWPPWDDLVAAGYRVTSDRRNVAPPVVLFEVQRQVVEGSVGDCLVIAGSVKASAIAPGPDNRDAMQWAWTGPVAVLMQHTDNDGAVLGDFEELPAVEVSIPFTHTTDPI